MKIRRKTNSVKLVEQYFNANAQAVSAVELVKAFDGSMNKTTVYRIVERLEEDGMIHSFTGKDGLRWYALCQDCGTHAHEHQHTHPHFQCNECGKVECLEEEMDLPAFQDRKVESVQLILTGICPACTN